MWLFWRERNVCFDYDCGEFNLCIYNTVFIHNRTTPAVIFFAF